MTDSNRISSLMRAILLLFCFFCVKQALALPNDTVMRKDIEEVVVVGIREPAVAQNKDDKISWSMKSLSSNVKIMGEADPLRYLQLLSGVQTGQDYSTGISVQGCNYSQTLVEMDGATVFYPYHLFGVFSSCNAGHFKKMDFEKSIHDGRFGNRLGGYVNMVSDDKLSDYFSGKINVGLLSSNVNLKIPLGNKVSATVSARASYMNLLYGSFMSDDTSGVHYDFYDTNLSLLYKPNEHNSITVNGYYGYDGIRFGDYRSEITSDLIWDNGAVSASWLHNADWSASSSVYLSWHNNNIDVRMPQTSFKAPSEIMEWGYKGYFKHSVGIGNIEGGANAIFRNICPQEVETIGYNGDVPLSKSTEMSHEITVFAQWRVPFLRKFEAVLGLKGINYGASDHFNQNNIDPFVTLNATWGTNSITLHTAAYRQYLHQIGISGNGFPTNFWVEANRSILPQIAKAVSVAYNKDLVNSAYSFNAEIYYKHILHDSEFAGSILDLIQPDYNPRSHIVEGDGFNAGLDLMLKKNYGKITGFACYSLGYSRRIFPGKSLGYVPSSRESLHNISLLLTWKINKHWDVSSNFVLASGAPTTPLRAVYIVGENYLNDYGAWNSTRLPTYHRLDLSCNYNFVGRLFNRQLRQSVNLSIVNAYAHKNVVMHHYGFSEQEDGSFRFVERKPGSIYKMMPSLSYSIEF